MSEDINISEDYLIRIQKVKVSLLFLADLLKGKVKPFVTNLPPDANFFIANVSFEGQTIEFLVASKEFPAILEGSVIPEFPIICTTIDEKK